MCRCFFGCDLVVHQDLVDDPQPRPQLRALHRLLPLVARRQRKLQHLPDRLPRQAELPRRLPDAHAVHLHGSSYARIHFHLVHLLVSHKHNSPCNVLELKCGGLLFDRHKPPLTRRFVVYYCSAVYSSANSRSFGYRPGEQEILEYMLRLRSSCRAVLNLRNRDAKSLFVVLNRWNTAQNLITVLYLISGLRENLRRTLAGW